MAFNPQEFRSVFAGDGARPNLFKVVLTFPDAVSSTFPLAGRNLQFMASATTLPASHVTVAPAFYFGREIKLPGVKQFDNWTIQIYNDEDFVIRNAFELWSEFLNGNLNNTRHIGFTQSRTYTTTGNIYQYAKDDSLGSVGRIIKTYRMNGLWPMAVGDIQVNWEDQNRIEVFQVTLAVQDWEMKFTQNTTNSFPDSIISYSGLI